jgi:hypothetical protein
MFFRLLYVINHWYIMKAQGENTFQKFVSLVSSFLIGRVIRHIRI